MLDVIAMDGPAAAGKSTVARRVADRLGYGYFDTGLLYRAVTKKALDSSSALDDEEALRDIAESLTIERRNDRQVTIDGISNVNELRTQKIDSAVSQVAAHPQVRKALIGRQRQIAETGRIVMVGRDITTVVAPDARLRVFLEASAAERARRRYVELQGRGKHVSYEDVLADIEERDRKDSSRETAPLVQDASVSVVDTEDKTVDEVVQEIVDLALGASSENDEDQASVKSAENGDLFSYRRRAMNFWVWPWMSRLFKIQQVGMDHIPSEGPLLYVSNHLHNLDPMLEYYAFPRPLHFMGKKELFDVPVVRQIAELSGGFPVDRGKFDREALRHVESRLDQGIAVGIYPEGGRSPTGALTEAKSGAGLMALKTGAPILPVAITGSERYPVNGKKGKMQASSAPRDPGHKGVRIVYGQPFLLIRQVGGHKIGPQEATVVIMNAVAMLLPPDYRGVYSEPPNSGLDRFKIPYSPSSSDSISSL